MIEQLFDISIEIDEVSKILEKLVFIEKKTYIDDYYYDPKRDNLKPKNNAIKETLKIRYSNNDNILIYNNKNIKIETNVDQNIIELLYILNYKKLARIETNETVYKVQESKIILKEIKGLGYYLKLETNENIEGIKSYLNITFSKKVELSILELLLNKYNKFKIKIAEKEDIEKMWLEIIKNNPNDANCIKYKNEAIDNFNKKTSIIYLGILDNEIITKTVAVININENELKHKFPEIIDNDTAYLASFSTKKEYEGKGYFRQVYNFMENDIKNRGFKYTTLGVEPSEVRNMLIYFQLGYNKLVKTTKEVYPNGKEITINFYKKTL